MPTNHAKQPRKQKRSKLIGLLIRMVLGHQHVDGLTCFIWTHLCVRLESQHDKVVTGLHRTIIELEAKLKASTTITTTTANRV